MTAYSNPSVTAAHPHGLSGQGRADLARTYLEQQVQTASPEQLLLMLYDGAIRFLKMAKKGLAEQNVEQSHNYLMKAQRIITEFMATLDVKVGGEPAKNLMALYEYYHYTLVQANLKKDKALIDEVIQHLSNLRQTWDEAIKIAKTDASPEILSLDVPRVPLPDRAEPMATATPFQETPSSGRDYSA